MNTLHRHEEERVEEVLQSLRAKGIRITLYSQSSSFLFSGESWTSKCFEKIYRDLLPQFPSMSLATVYNNIKVLIDEGVVSEIKVRNDTTTYFDFMGHDHLNVVCENVAVSQMWTLKSQIFAKKQPVKVATRSPRPKWPSMVFCSECQKQWWRYSKRAVRLFCEKLHFSMVATRFLLKI